jgi:hypothetical protein
LVHCNITEMTKALKTALLRENPPQNQTCSCLSFLDGVDRSVSVKRYASIYRLGAIRKMGDQAIDPDRGIRR